MNRRVDAARQAASQSNQSTQELLSKYGLADSAFGARTIAELNQQNNQRVAEIPADVTQEMLDRAPGIALGTSELGAGMLGRAAGLDINRTDSSSQFGFGFDLGDAALLAGSL